MKIRVSHRQLLIAIILVLMLVLPFQAFAHCDTMDGMVVSAGRKALETGNVNHALIWVKPGHEPAVQSAFEKALAGRQSGISETGQSDMRFFETLVREHRAGEGEPFTGLKPSGTGVTRAISAADRAVEGGSPAEVLKLVPEAKRAGVEQRYSVVMARKDFEVNDVGAGRDYVESYVDYIKYVEEATEPAPHA